jgi:hypothetical protein
MQGHRNTRFTSNALLKTQKCPVFDRSVKSPNNDDISTMAWIDTVVRLERGEAQGFEYGVNEVIPLASQLFKTRLVTSLRYGN